MEKRVSRSTIWPVPGLGSGGSRRSDKPMRTFSTTSWPVYCCAAAKTKGLPYTCVIVHSRELEMMVALILVTAVVVAVGTGYYASKKIDDLR